MDILARDIVEKIAREIDREAWRFRTCKPGSDKDRRREKSLEKAGRIWAAISPMIKERFVEISLS